MGKYDQITDETMIEIKNLSKVYHLYERPVDRLREVLSIRHNVYHKKHFALKNINLEIKKGESIGIIGVNGSGKSTLLKLVTGVLNPSEGEVKTYGKIAALLELGAGFNPEYTGIENIFLNGTMMGYSEEEMREKLDSIIAFADIGEFIRQPVKLYSSGMFARLAFAVSISVEPEILIVDEALAVGDTRFQVKCIDKMKQLKEAGTTILFVSHATEQIKRFCTRSIWLRDGMVFRDGEASQVVDLYENFMRYGEKILKDSLEEEDSEGAERNTPDENNMEHAMPKDMLAVIRKVRFKNQVFHTFDELKLEIEYEILEEQIDGFLLGAAIYTKDREEYIFGPNTFLDKVKLSGKKGKYLAKYTIPKLPLIRGEYVLDVGIFNNEGIVNLDYRMNAAEFAVSNHYFSEGLVYMEHEWDVKEI